MSRHGPARVAYRDCMADQDLLAALLTLERKGWDSLCDGTGDAFYGEMMTEDAVMVLANGEVMDRDTVVAALGRRPPGSATTSVNLNSSTPDQRALHWCTAGLPTGRQTVRLLSV